MNCKPDKITQMAARFLKQANGKLPYIILVKMMYYADKQMLIQYGEPITFDRWVSMKHGPVLSVTLNFIRSPEECATQDWLSHMSTHGYDIELKGDPGDGALSELEIEVIDEVFNELKDPSGEYSKEFVFGVVDHTHLLPEWDENTANGGSTDITYGEVLRLAGVSKEMVAEILGDIGANEYNPMLLKAA